MCDKIEWEVHLSMFLDSRTAHVWSVVHDPDEASEPRFDSDQLPFGSLPVKAFFELIDTLERLERFGEQQKLPFPLEPFSQTDFDPIPVDELGTA